MKMSDRNQHAIWAFIAFVVMFLQVTTADHQLIRGWSMGAVFTSFGVILFIVSVSFLFKGRGKIAYLAGAEIFISAIALFNLLYFRYYHRPPTVYTLMQAQNLNGLGPSIWEAAKGQDLLFILPVLILPIVGFRLYRPQSDRRWLWMGAMVALSAMIIAVKPVKLLATHTPLTQRMTSLSFVENYGILGAHALDYSLYLSESQKRSLTEPQVQQIRAVLGQSYPLSPEAPAAGRARGYNLIMIQVESLQNFVIGRSVGGQAITPNLNRLLDHSLYFTHFYAQTIDGNSSDAELLTNTSLFPVAAGSTYFRFPYNDYFSLGKMLKSQGYQTAAFHGDEKDFWNRDQIYPHLGFDRFYSLEHFRRDDMIGMGLGDRSFLAQCGEIIGKQKPPFYDFLITLTSHTPFKIPEKEQTLPLPPELKNRLLGDYLESIHYTDAAIGAFIKDLEARHLLDRTLIVLYGDHKGIFKQDRGSVEKLVGSPISDETWIREYTNVPFMIYNPGFSRRVVTKNAGQIDVLPTLAYLMGIPERAYVSQTLGHNIFSASPDQVLLPSGDYEEQALIRGNAVTFDVPEKEKEALKISDWIIRGDYFRMKEPKK